MKEALVLASVGPVNRRLTFEMPVVSPVAGVVVGHSEGSAGR